MVNQPPRSDRIGPDAPDGPEPTPHRQERRPAPGAPNWLMILPLVALALVLMWYVLTRGEPRAPVIERGPDPAATEVVPAMPSPAPEAEPQLEVAPSEPAPADAPPPPAAAPSEPPVGAAEEPNRTDPTVPPEGSR